MIFTKETLQLIQQYLAAVGEAYLSYRQAAKAEPEIEDIFSRFAPKYVTEQPDEPILAIAKKHGVTRKRQLIECYVPAGGWIEKQATELKEKVVSSLRKDLPIEERDVSKLAGSSLNPDLVLGPKLLRLLFETALIYLVLLPRSEHKEAAKRAIEELDQTLNPERYVSYTSAYLFNFNVDSNSFRSAPITETLSIRLTTFDDLVQSANANVPGQFLPPPYIITAKSDQPYFLAIMAWNSFAPIHDNLDDFVTALRLLKSGYVARGDAIMWSEGINLGLTYHSFVSDPKVHQMVLGYMEISERFTVRTKEFRTVAKIYEQLRSPDRAKLNFAIAQFNSYYTRVDDREKIVDLTIALENLFCQDSISQTTENTYRLRVRAARYLGKTLAKRLELFTLFGKLYQMRSSIVHGNEKGAEKKWGMSLREIIQRIEPLVRQALRQMLENPSHKDEKYQNDLLLS